MRAGAGVEIDEHYPGRIDDTPGSNAWIEDGALIIEARAENYEHRKFTSARLNTKGKKEFLFQQSPDHRNR